MQKLDGESRSTDASSGNRIRLQGVALTNEAEGPEQGLGPGSSMA